MRAAWLYLVIIVIFLVLFTGALFFSIRPALEGAIFAAGGFLLAWEMVSMLVTAGPGAAETGRKGVKNRQGPGTACPGPCRLKEVFEEVSVYSYYNLPR